MPTSLADWWRLNRADQLAVGIAVDHGERIEDPRLRPIAAALASGLLKYNGWRMFRRPWYPIMLVVLFVGLVVLGMWWWLLGDVLLGLIVFWSIERQARRLRPQWSRAIVANTDVPDH